MNGRPGQWLGPGLTVLMFVVLWEVLCRALKVPSFILPTPSESVTALFSQWNTIWPNAYHTLLTTCAGFAISVVFGLTLGMLFGVSDSVYRCVNPLLIAFNSIPKVAIVPVLVLWFGIGTVPAILTAFLLSFFPIVVNVAAGIATTEPELVDVLRSIGATRFDILIKVGLPRSLPYFFASLKVAITLAFVGAIMSETVASNEGVGYLMLAASSSFQIPLVFASLLLVAVLGVAMYALAALVEQRCTGWASRMGTGAHSTIT
ncbi:ABC transporter permease [Bradyrhizobium canariense]|uniref:NitT/TauT family transport system permease protein n=1 Tax=Bradyrhizobium canariense TaxID=255045 RepID=A0A1H2BDS6_9BRAD|nr:ABC transporter permease [Bradyrhizobium canariense]SDT56413.1 NitT/TauT family transport system permease protein [Bradyrhizobium canariense]